MAGLIVVVGAVRVLHVIDADCDVPVAYHVLDLTANRVR